MTVAAAQHARYWLTEKGAAAVGQKPDPRDVRIAELEDIVERARVACIPLGPLAASVRGVLEGDLAQQRPFDRPAVPASGESD